MTEANSISALFPNTSAAPTTARSPDELGQDDFMELMVAQLRNQDPTKPMDNFQFLSQIAQFGTVNGIQGLQTGFDELAASLTMNQSLQAAGLVGSKVMSDSNLGLLTEGDSLGATIDLRSSASSVRLYIQDMSGRLIHSRDLGPANAGQMPVEWNGTDDNGEAVAPGQYRISAEFESNGQMQAASVYAHATVDSVSIEQGGAGIILNLSGGDQVPIQSVKRFL